MNVLLIGTKVMRHGVNALLFVVLAVAAVACTWVPGVPSADPPAATATPERAAEPAAASAAAVAAPVDFASQVLPIVRRCEPCHFEGGKMYAELPFDDPATVRRLGEALFTRIKGPDEQALLRAFFAQPAPES
jgi:hypothetical protein